MKTEFLPFTGEMIPAAGKLLAQRHSRNREKQPLLPARFEDPQAAAQAVEALWQSKFRNGYAAFCDGRMVAYLIGETSTNPWGRAGTVHLPGYAVADSENPAILQDLYALLGEDWVRKGCFAHYHYIAAQDEDIIAALFDIGFGKERVDALLDLRTIEIPEIKEPSGITIRQASKGDNELVGSLSDVIFRALAKAPYWHPTVPEDWDDLHEGWSELPDDKEWTVWLALEGQKALGTIGFRPEPESDTHLLAPPKTVYLSVAATKPEARGRGVGAALSWHGLDQARKQGYETCYSNWISPNLLASRFWPRFGFQDAAYRLAKKVNPMIAWTRIE
ncbi:MAG TPA: GNAT family N-acetyltransferase [Anaerolineales bacterium]|nr:GNAT family N-acetyltransferase [Anaerolineales bacterium]